MVLQELELDRNGPKNKEDLSQILGIPSDELQSNSVIRSRKQLVIGICAGSCAVIGSVLVPFLAPGFRKIALPYLPATNRQVSLISAFLAGSRANPVQSVGDSAACCAGKSILLRDEDVNVSLKANQLPGRMREAIWSGRRFVDLGSGDGRLVISAAEQGLLATGVELNWWLVLLSRLKSIQAGSQVWKRCKFVRKDLFKTDLKDYEVIVLFGVDGMMELIHKKLVSELREDALFIACRFPLPNCSAFTSFGSGVDTVWIYRRTDLT